MSDRHESAGLPDPGALELLDRAAEFAPEMAIRPEDVVAVGRRRVRRRRATGTGIGVVALAGAFWVAGSLNPLGTADVAEPIPASVNWNDGLETEFFDNAPHQSETGRTHWAGELRSAEGDAEPHLVLTQDGVELDPIAAEDGPGDVMVFRQGNLAVAVWDSPAGSTGEHLLWNPGHEWGQGGTFLVDGIELWYASAEFVPGAEPGLVDLYWFSDEGAYAASGAVVDSTVLTAGDAQAVIMVDEARGVWGTNARPTLAPGRVHVERLKSGSGYTGWLPAQALDQGLPGQEGFVPTSVGVLPPGATLSDFDSAATEAAAGTVGAHTVVLAADSTMSMGTPTIKYTLGDRESNLQSYVETQWKTIQVADATVTVDGRPDGLQLFVSEREQAFIPSQDLDGAGALVGAVGSGQVVVVPGWQPDADAADLRVQLAPDQEWVPVDSAHVGTQFDGSPLVVLGLDASLADGESIIGVGLADGDVVVPHDLDGGVLPVDLDL